MRLSNALPTFFLSAVVLGTGLHAQDASLTVLHGVPGLPGAVDVVANGGTLFSFCYGEQRGPLSLPAGNYAVEVRLDGATILSANYALAAGDDVSVIANLDAAGAPTLTPFGNDGSPLALPASRVTVRHTAEAPAVDVVFRQGGSTALTIPNVSNGQEASADVPPGTYDVELFLAGTTSSAFGPAPVTVEDGFRYGVFAVGQALTPSFRLLVQRDALTAHVRSLQGLEVPGGDPLLELDGVLLFDYATQVEDAVAVQPGTYQLKVKGFGGLVTLVDRQVTLAAGEDRSLFPYLGATNTVTLGDFANDVSAPSLAGNARVTIRHTAHAPTVDVLVERNGQLLATVGPLSNGEEAVAELPAGTYDVSIAPTGTTSAVFGPVALTFDARTNTIASAIGALGSTFTVAVETIELAAPSPSELLTSKFGVACGPTLSVESNCLFFDEDLAITATGGQAGTPCLFVAGSQLASPIDTTSLGAPGCEFWINAIFQHQSATFDGAGEATVVYQVPSLVATSFTRAIVQAVAVGTNPLGFVTSDVVLVTRN